MMNLPVMKLKQMKRLLPYVAFFTASLSLFATNPDCKKDPCKSGCPGAGDTCKCPNGKTTGAGSIRFKVDVTGYVSGDLYNKGALRFDHMKPSLTMYSVQGLQYYSAAASAVTGVSGDFTASEVVELTVTDKNGWGIGYTVADGSTTGIAVQETYRDDYELTMLDANEAPVADATPAYIKLEHLGEDAYVIYDFSTGDAIRRVDETGRVTDYSGTRVVRIGGVMRQIVTPDGLVDFVTIDPDFEYEIRFYRNADIDPVGPDVNGVYSFLSGAEPWQVYDVRNPAYDDQDIDEAYITRQWDGRTTEWRFHYYPANDLWEMQVGELTSGTFELKRIEEASQSESQDGLTYTYNNKAKNPTGELLSEHISVKEDLGEAGILETFRSMDPTGANLTTTKSYYTSGVNAGQTKSFIEPDGQWSAYAYDADDRVTLEVEAWKDFAFDDSVALSTLALSAKATYSDYTPVDTNDDGTLRRGSPRTEIVKIEDVVTAIIWNAYYRDAGGLLHEITERATSQGASYGDAANLHSESIYYATTAQGESALRAGRLKSKQREDGTWTTYEYTEDANGDFTVTETHVHADAPGGVANKSTRTLKTYDEAANLTKEEFFVYDGSAYQSVYYLAHTYDEDRNRIETRRYDGIAGGRVLYSADYTHGKATTVTDETGRVVYSTYDVLGRKELQVVEGSAEAGVGDISEHYTYSTAATGCGCTASETQIMDESGTLTMTKINETDRVKRKSRMVDVNGLETTYEYTGGGRVTTETRPDGSTRITTNYLDGRVKSVAGTGVIPEYYTYGVNADGTTWTRVDAADGNYLGTEDVSTVTDLRYRKATDDMAGRILREESPAFGGNILLTEYVYDDYGRLESQIQPGRADTRYEYDSMGNRVRSGLDVDDNGQLDLASEDRITDSVRIYGLEGGAWFDVSTTTVYPTTNDSTAVTVSTNKNRLSGFSGSLASETTAIDVHGNATLRKTEIDRVNKTVTRTTDVPGSVIDAVSVTINGYLKEQNSTAVAAVSTYGYDGLGRRTSIKDPRHTQASSIDYYTGTRQVFTQTDAAGNATAFTYVPQGRAGAGQIASVTDALLQKSYRAYDLLGRQVRTWGETDYPQEYSYNSYGELVTLTTYRDAVDGYDFTTAIWPNPTGGDTTTWTYQVATGLFTRKEYADGNGTDYAYDSVNRLSVRTWARDGGLDTTYGYDAATGELTSVDYEDANTADIAYTYDRLGRQATVTDATGTRSFAYDGNSLQLDSEELPTDFYGDLVLTRTYEDGTEANGLAGRAKGYDLIAGGQTSVAAAAYGYENTGRLQAISDGSDTFTYAYENNANLLASLTAPQHTVSYSYEADRDVMTSIDNQVSGSTLSKYAYTYDALGRRADRVQSGSAISNASTDDFAYNSRSEVTGSTNSLENAAEWNSTYTYDKIGNRQSSTGFQPVSSYTANALNQYTAIDSATPTHDLDGNLTSAGGNWTYTWNNENRLASGTDGTTTINFTYDYQGRLVKKDDGTDVEVYVYDGWNRIFSISNPGSQIETTTSFLCGLDLSGSMQGAGGVGGLLKEGNRYPTYDANGNIVQKLNSNGGTDMTVVYDPFGNIIDGTLVGEYGFSTKPLIDGIDWYYYGFRYYDPVTGRWPSRDPINQLGSSEWFYKQFIFQRVAQEVYFKVINLRNSINQRFYGARSFAIDWSRVVSDVMRDYGVNQNTRFFVNLSEEKNLYLSVDNNAENEIDILGKRSYTECYNDCVNTALFGIPGQLVLGGGGLISFFYGGTVIGVGAGGLGALAGAAQLGCAIGCAEEQSCPGPKNDGSTTSLIGNPAYY